MANVYDAMVRTLLHSAADEAAAVLSTRGPKEQGAIGVDLTGVDMKGAPLDVGVMVVSFDPVLTQGIRTLLAMASHNPDPGKVH